MEDKLYYGTKEPISAFDRRILWPVLNLLASKACFSLKEDLNQRSHQTDILECTHILVLRRLGFFAILSKITVEIYGIGSAKIQNDGFLSLYCQIFMIQAFKRQKSAQKSGRKAQNYGKCY